MKRVSALLLILGMLATATACSGSTSATRSTACLGDAAAACREADLSGADLSGRDLSGRDFTGAILKGANLRDANLTGADLDHADLTGAVLDGAVLKGATLFDVRAINSSWRKADMSDADLEGTDLRGADLTGTVLSGARLHDVNLADGLMLKTDLTGALLARVFLGGTDMTGANLSHAMLPGTSFADASTTGVTWTGAILRADDLPPVGIVDSGAIVCDDASCSGTPGRGPFTTLDVSADAFRSFTFAAARFGSVYGEGPVVVSRGLALFFMSAYGVYPEARDVNIASWKPEPQDGIDAVRDVAAVVAGYNSGIAIRRNPRGTAFDGRMRGLILARDITFWELTREAPESRGLVAVVAADAAKHVLARAQNDGFAKRTTEYDGKGAWKPTAPALVPALEPGWGSMLRYIPTSTTCAAPAPQIDSDVAALEARTIADQASQDQKNAARFWDDERIRTATPPGHWVIIAAQVLAAGMVDGDVSARESVRTMLDVSIAMADSFIQVWADKYQYRTARPITIIQTTDPDWNSYLGNPPFPSYPSGHAAVSRAAAEVLTRHLGDVAFSDQGGNESAGGWLALGIEPRSFANFTEAADESGMSRIWGGIHTMDDYVGANHIGSCIARLTDQRVGVTP